MDGRDFGDFIFHYWWLFFPLAFFIAGGWSSFMRYKRTQAKIDLLKAYAAAGKEPPADLVASLDKDRGNDDDWDDGSEDMHGQHKKGSTPFLVVLFAGLAGVFGFAGYTNLLGEVDAFYFIALILGVLSLAFLVSGLFRR
ncbi:hypothetical protein RMQ97_08440 [Maricaulis sp. D1M11]|uniref:hypothetical protein n=1 Tax=Maricaulis sp. D1M11 TaxID=3076117 RepID=UPI0039B59CC4